jgi:hypothetical protein
MFSTPKKNRREYVFKSLDRSFLGVESKTHPLKFENVEKTRFRPLFYDQA